MSWIGPRSSVIKEQTRQGRRWGRLLLLLSVLSIPCTVVQAAESEPPVAHKVTGRLRITYDATTLPGNEPMGLLGVNYLFNLPSSFYIGFGGYGAVDGQRGGFFTGGLEAGWEPWLVGPMYFDVGAFAGGGGGGAAPQGGGLMVRPHVGLLFEVGRERYGLAYSWVDYPNGGISSRQLAFQFEHPVSSIYANSSLSGRRIAARELPADAAAGARLSQSDFSAVTYVYSPVSGSRVRGGGSLTTESTLVGIRWRRFIRKDQFIALEGAGAAGGVTDGYAQVLATLGYTFDFGRRRQWSILGRSGFGAGGGGAVDTGGGLLTQTEVGVSHVWRHGLSAELGVGYVSAPEGHYQAWTGSLRLGYAFHTLGYVRGGRRLSEDDQLDVFTWRLHSVHETYTAPAWKGARRASTLQLIGVKSDYLLNDNFSVSGQALAAYEGGAGGYAVGLLGAGWTSNPSLNHKLRLVVDAGLGAAGGGGIDTGGGAIAQGTIGVAYIAGKHLDLTAAYGQAVALDGGLDTPVIEFGLSYRFASLGRKP
jgi:hypothetical protein